MDLHADFNPLTLTDVYKFTHWKIYPPGMTRMYSYLASRGGRFSHTVFFGPQYVLQRWLCGPIVTTERIEDAQRTVMERLGRWNAFNRAGWEHIRDDHAGHLPLEIRALPEGTRARTGNVLLTVENTCPRCAWLTNYVETLLVQLWAPITVATLTWEIKRLIREAWKRHADPEALKRLPMAMVNFGFRGDKSVDAAALDDLAFLVNFAASDTTHGATLAARYYDEPSASQSIPATEHSTITVWGRDREVDAYRAFLDAYPEGPIACVSDSYDIENAITNLWGGTLRDRVLGRDGWLGIRPDSGNPVATVPRNLHLMGKVFPHRPNSRHCDVLDPHVGLVQGDGINLASIPKILEATYDNGWCPSNIVFGSGGGIMQQGIDRDTLNFAMKASWAEVDGRGLDVYKDPVDMRSKTSKRGRFKVVQREGEFVTIPEAAAPEEPNWLELVYRNGRMVRLATLATIRDRAGSFLT